MFSPQHFSASWVWKLLRVQISKWFLLSIADDCANGLWVLADSRERLRSGAEYFLPERSVWMRLKYLPILATSSWCEWEQKIAGTKNRFEELDDCDGCYVAFTVAELTCYNQLDWLIDFDWLNWFHWFGLILIDIIHMAVRLVSAWDGGKTEQPRRQFFEKDDFSNAATLRKQIHNWSS